MKRRHLLYSLSVLSAGTLSARWGLSRLARSAPPDSPLSAEALAMVDKAWEGVDPARMVDCHVHIVGLGTDCTGCYVNPRTSQPVRHPLTFLKFSMYRHAAGVEDEANADRQYRERLLSLLEAPSMRGRALVLAFDSVHDEQGQPHPELSEFHTPNDYVLKLAQDNPQHVLAGASIHPYRADAVDELERVAALGARAVKWLPNAMNIHPGSPRCDAFYRKLAELKMPLITHAGEEQAVEGKEAQALGNPLHLRRALDAGVKVVVAHAASLGTGEDLDKPGASLSNFELFLRLMSEERFKGLLYADFSAVTQHNRCGQPLRELLMREELHSRLVHGSDYPLPAINALIRTGTLEDLGYITADERRVLNELDRHNPLVFDFVLKRTLAVRQEGKTYRFPASAFMPPEGLLRGV
ncbi:MAG: amidohydrolase family protein [Hyalangium sp.]|uniref:amidohydrolase family protein n=1 Tax=Hyalangium sp. TaxID=2028555 RepID=UPI00389ABCC0